MNWIEQIKEYIPCNEQEEKDKEIILNCIDTFDDILTRSNRVCHITSSAFVVNKKRDKALMIHHNIYNSWSWTGGHADGDEDLLSVAIREVQEETGVKSVKPISIKIASLDILHVIGHIKKGEYVSPHLHFSIAFLAEVDENEVLIVKEDENSEVRWFLLEEVNIKSSEPHMKRVYEKLIFKINELL